MNVVHEVDAQSGQFQHQLCVVGVCVPVLPSTIVVHVPQVNDVSGERGTCIRCIRCIWVRCVSE